MQLGYGHILLPNLTHKQTNKLTFFTFLAKIPRPYPKVFTECRKNPFEKLLLWSPASSFFPPVSGKKWFNVVVEVPGLQVCQGKPLITVVTAAAGWPSFHFFFFFFCSPLTRV